jgi:hypothetical protein
LNQINHSEELNETKSYRKELKKKRILKKELKKESLKKGIQYRV